MMLRSKVKMIPKVESKRLLSSLRIYLKIQGVTQRHSDKKTAYHILLPRMHGVYLSFLKTDTTADADEGGPSIMEFRDNGRKASIPFEAGNERICVTTD